MSKWSATQLEKVQQFLKEVYECSVYTSLVVARYIFQSHLFENCYFRSKLIFAINCRYYQFLFINSSQKNNFFASYFSNLSNVSAPVAGVLIHSAIKKYVSNVVDIHIRLTTRSFQQFIPANVIISELKCFFFFIISFHILMQKFACTSFSGWYFARVFSVTLYF